MAKGGYILLYRSFLDWEWYGDANTQSVFLHLLLTANFEDKKWQGVTIKRGQTVSSLSKISTRCGLSIRQARTALEHLKSTGEVTHEKTSQYSVFTVVNYDKYQTATSETTGERQANDTHPDKRATRTLTSERQQLNNYKEIINKRSNKERVKHAHGEYANVMLTDDEFDKLKSEFQDWQNRIDRLSEYIESKGAKYKSHYATIKAWARKDKSTEKANFSDPDRYSPENMRW